MLSKGERNISACNNDSHWNRTDFIFFSMPPKKTSNFTSHQKMTNKTPGHFITLFNTWNIQFIRMKNYFISSSRCCRNLTFFWAIEQIKHTTIYFSSAASIFFSFIMIMILHLSDTPDTLFKSTAPF